MRTKNVGKIDASAEEVQTGAPEIETKKEENKEWQCVR